MERFALAAAVVLGFALTAALCSLFVPLRRVLERREQQQPVQSEQPRPAPLRAPLWGGLCAAAGTVAAVGVGWLAACVGQPELLGSEGRLMTRLLTALAGSLAFGAVGLAEDLARMRSPAALGLRRDVRLLLEALAAAFVLLLLRAAGCLPRGLGVPGAGYVLLGSAVPFFVGGAHGGTGRVCPHRRAGRGYGVRCGLCGHAGFDDGRSRSGRFRAGGAARRACRGAGGTAAVGISPGKAGCGLLRQPAGSGCHRLHPAQSGHDQPDRAAGAALLGGGRSLAAQLLCAKAHRQALALLGKKHKMSPETVFLCSFALSAVGYVLALALLRWC